MLTASSDGTVKLWDAKTSECLLSYRRASLCRCLCWRSMTNVTLTALLDVQAGSGPRGHHQGAHCPHHTANAQQSRPHLRVLQGAHGAPRHRPGADCSKLLVRESHRSRLCVRNCVSPRWVLFPRSNAAFSVDVDCVLLIVDVLLLLVVDNVHRFLVAAALARACVVV